MTTVRTSISSSGSTTTRPTRAWSAVWTKFWAYLSLNDIAPVWVGEFGTTNNTSDIESNVPGSQGQWFQSIVTFLQNNPQLDWTYWALNGEDSYALLDSNYDSTPGQLAEAAAAGQHSVHRRRRKLQQRSCRAHWTRGYRGFLQPDQPDLERRHAAAELQRHLQRLLQQLRQPLFTRLRRIGSPPAWPQPTISNTGLHAVDDLLLHCQSGRLDRRVRQLQRRPAPPRSRAAVAAATSPMSTRMTGAPASPAPSRSRTPARSQINGWTLTWTWSGNQQIIQSWNSNYTQSGQNVALTNAAWNGTIGAGDTLTGIGFNANYSGTNNNPTTFYVNGTLCQ